MGDDLHIRFPKIKSVAFIFSFSIAIKASVRKKMSSSIFKRNLVVFAQYVLTSFIIITVFSVKLL